MVVLLTLLCLLIFGCNSRVSDPKYKVDSKFTLPGVNFPANTYVLDYKIDDVNGDMVKDDIVLTGQKDDIDGVYSYGVSIIIVDGKNQKFEKITPRHNEGYGAYLSIGQYNYDNVSDIFYGTNTGGNGGASISSYDIFSFKENKVGSLLGDDRLRDRVDFDVVFLPNYKLRIRNQEIHKTFIVDVKDHRGEYDSVVYDNGKLIQETVGGADDYYNIRPIDTDGDGNLELEALQYISGCGRSDAIGEVHSILKLDRKSLKWVVKSITFKKY